MRYEPCCVEDGSYITLPPEELHLWAVTVGNEGVPCTNHLQTAVATLSMDYSTILTAEEQLRALSFRFEEDRTRFCHTRATLRRLLGLYTGLPPQDIRFHHGPYGKPFLAAEADRDMRGDDALQVGPPISFNVSHAGSLALLAFSRAGEIGVDIERNDGEIDALAIADSQFAREEAATLRAVPPDSRRNLFFDYWTLKEAVVKATGHGLHHPLNTFAVRILPGNQAQMLWPLRLSPSESVTKKVWTLLRIPPTDGYAAAVAVFGRRVTRIRCRWWTWEQ